MNIKDVTGAGGARPVDASRGNADTPPKRSTSQTSDTAGTSDQLSLTAIGQFLASTGAGESAPVDQQRVDEIRSALANGTYQIDSERVAAKLLGLDRSLV